MEQMSIFDFLRDERDLSTLTSEDAADIIGERLGLRFSLSRLGDYRTTVKIGGVKVTLEVEMSTYFDSRIPVILVGASARTSGSGAPCDSIDEAVEYFKREMRRKWT